MAHRSKKLQVAAAVAVCSLAFTASAAEAHKEAREIEKDNARHLPELVPTGPENLYLLTEKQSVANGGLETVGTGEMSKKKKKELKLAELKLKKAEKKLRRRKRHDSDASEHKPRSDVRRRLQKALNIFTMLVEAILSFTECFGESGPLQKLKNVLPPPTRAVFRHAAEEFEDMQESARFNCALGAVTKAAALFEDAESRAVLEEVAAADSVNAGPTYFVADPEVLADQALQLASWISAQAENLRSALAVLRSDVESSESEDEFESGPVVAIKENPTSRLPSIWKVITPDDPAQKSFTFDIEDSSENHSTN